MANKGNGSIIDPKNLKEKDFELVGREAIDLAFLVKENVPIPASFVIPTVVFDEFLVQNNLVGPIAKELKKVRPFIKKSAIEASASIKKIIFDANLSENFVKELEDAYQKLSKHNENPIVIIIPSHIIEEKFVPAPTTKFKEILLQGIDDLIYQIKVGWSEIFSPDAIEYRANGYYKGEISLGLIVQKLIRSEISGHSYSATVFSKNEIEIKASFGIETPEVIGFADSYVIDKKTFQITNKHIVPQDYMFIHELNTKQKEKFTKVELSPNWKKNQKLEDDAINYIAKLTRKIETLFRQEVAVKWGFEAGEIFILELDPLDLPEIEHKKEKESTIEKLITKENKTIKEKEPDIEKLADEVMEIAEGKEAEPLIGFEEPKVNAPEEKFEDKDIAFPLLNKDKEPADERIKYFDEFEIESALYLDISKMNSRHLSALSYFGGSFFDGTEVILNNNILPEEHSTNQKVLINLLDKYSLDISTAARCAIHKPMIYQLSTISDMELKLLGIKEGKYKYNLDERFIDYPESLGLEVMAIKKSRTQHNSRNLHLSISGVRNLSNLEDIKKVLEASGLKRTTAFRLYAEVCVPSFIFELDRIGKDQIDGIIVNYSTLLRALTFRNEIRDIDHLVGMKALELLKNIAKEKNLEFIIRINNYSEELMTHIAKLKPQSIIFTSIPSEATLKTISSNQ